MILIKVVLCALIFSLSYSQEFDSLLGKEEKFTRILINEMFEFKDLKIHLDSQEMARSVKITLNEEIDSKRDFLVHDNLQFSKEDHPDIIYLTETDENIYLISSTMRTISDNKKLNFYKNIALWKISYGTGPNSILSPTLVFSRDFDSDSKNSLNFSPKDVIFIASSETIYLLAFEGKPEIKRNYYLVKLHTDILGNNKIEVGHQMNNAKYQNTCSLILLPSLTDSSLRFIIANTVVNELLVIDISSTGFSELSRRGINLYKYKTHLGDYYHIHYALNKFLFISNSESETLDGGVSIIAKIDIGQGFSDIRFKLYPSIRVINSYVDTTRNTYFFESIQKAINGEFYHIFFEYRDSFDSLRVSNKILLTPTLVDKNHFITSDTKSIRIKEIFIGQLLGSYRIDIITIKQIRNGVEEEIQIYQTLFKDEFMYEVLNSFWTPFPNTGIFTTFANDGVFFYHKSGIPYNSNNKTLKLALIRQKVIIPKVEIVYDAKRGMDQFGTQVVGISISAKILNITAELVIQENIIRRYRVAFLDTQMEYTQRNLIFSPKQSEKVYISSEDDRPQIYRMIRGSLIRQYPKMNKDGDILKLMKTDLISYNRIYHEDKKLFDRIIEYSFMEIKSLNVDLQSIDRIDYNERVYHFKVIRYLETLENIFIWDGEKYKLIVYSGNEKLEKREESDIRINKIIKILSWIERIYIIFCADGNLYFFEDGKLDDNSREYQGGQCADIDLFSSYTLGNILICVTKEFTIRIFHIDLLYKQNTHESLIYTGFMDEIGGEALYKEIKGRPFRFIDSIQLSLLGNSVIFIRGQKIYEKNILILRIYVSNKLNIELVGVLDTRPTIKQHYLAHFAIGIDAIAIKSKLVILSMLPDESAFFLCSYEIKPSQDENNLFQYISCATIPKYFSVDPAKAELNHLKTTYYNSFKGAAPHEYLTLQISDQKQMKNIILIDPWTSSTEILKLLILPIGAKDKILSVLSLTYNEIIENSVLSNGLLLIDDNPDRLTSKKGLLLYFLNLPPSQSLANYEYKITEHDSISASQISQNDIEIYYVNHMQMIYNDGDLVAKKYTLLLYSLNRNNIFSPIEGFLNSTEIDLRYELRNSMQSPEDRYFYSMNLNNVSINGNILKINAVARVNDDISLNNIESLEFYKYKHLKRLQDPLFGKISLNQICLRSYYSNDKYTDLVRRNQKICNKYAILIQDHKTTVAVDRVEDIEKNRYFRLNRHPSCSRSTTFKSMLIMACDLFGKRNIVFVDIETLETTEVSIDEIGGDNALNLEVQALSFYKLNMIIIKQYVEDSLNGIQMFQIFVDGSDRVENMKLKTLFQQTFSGISAVLISDRITKTNGFVHLLRFFSSEQGFFELNFVKSFDMDFTSQELGKMIISSDEPLISYYIKVDQDFPDNRLMNWRVQALTLQKLSVNYNEFTVFMIHPPNMHSYLFFCKGTHVKQSRTIRLSNPFVGMKHFGSTAPICNSWLCVIPSVFKNHSYLRLYHLDKKWIDSLPEQFDRDNKTGRASDIFETKKDVNWPYYLSSLKENYTIYTFTIINITGVEITQIIWDDKQDTESDNLDFFAISSESKWTRYTISKNYSIKVNSNELLSNWIDLVFVGSNGDQLRKRINLKNIELIPIEEKLYSSIFSLVIAFLIIIWILISLLGQEISKENQQEKQPKDEELSNEELLNLNER